MYEPSATGKRDLDGMGPAGSGAAPAPAVNPLPYTATSSMWPFSAWRLRRRQAPMAGRLLAEKNVPVSGGWATSTPFRYRRKAAPL